MTYSETEKAFSDLERRRLTMQARLLARQDEIYKKIPLVRQLTREITALGADYALAAIAKNNRAMDKRKNEIAGKTRQRKRLLEEAGYSEKDLELEYSCPDCKDTGYVNGKLCHCVKKSITDYKQQQLTRLSPMPDNDFDSFSLDYYSKEPIQLANGQTVTAYDTMSRILKYCKAYAEKFKKDSKSLIFVGSAGLGKTHLACRIAKVCRENGFTVMYTSCQSLFNTIEQSRYSGGELPQHILDCDLLILDDLGAENMTNYSLSALYNIINTRMITNRPCIYTTNLTSRQAVQKRYGEKISSRLFGGCNVFYFQGQDIRLKKNGMY